MSLGSSFRSQLPSRQRDTLVRGLQCAFGMMMAHQIAGKAVRDGLFLSHFGTKALPAMIVGAAGFSVLLSLLSGRFLSRIPPRILVPRSFAISGVLQFGEYVLLGVRPGLTAVLVYLHMAGIGAILLSTFWSMLSEEFDPREAKRRFGQIAGGGTIGGLIGGMTAARFAVRFEVSSLLLSLALLHLACGGFCLYLGRKAPQAGRPGLKLQADSGSLRDVLKSAYLFRLGALILLASTGAALLDYVFKVEAAQALGTGPKLVRFFAIYYTGTALLISLFQSFATQVVLERYGLGKAVSALPATLFAGCSLALVVPGMTATAMARAGEAVIRGSLFRAGYEICYTPVPVALKRRAKTIIDVGFERAGDAAGGGLALLCLWLSPGGAPLWIIAIAGALGLSVFTLTRFLDRQYVSALADSLMNRSIDFDPNESLDLTTRSVLTMHTAFSVGAELGAPPPSGLEDAKICGNVDLEDERVLAQLEALRSGDPSRIRPALASATLSRPLLAAQVVRLLGETGLAQEATHRLSAVAGKIVGLLSDSLVDRESDVTVRKRIPRILAASGVQAVPALMFGLEDPRFEVRFQCARGLRRVLGTGHSDSEIRARIMIAVDRELSVGKLLWESHRMQQTDPASLGLDSLDDVLREKAHGSLEYVFTLLSLVHERGPLMVAFRSLHTDDSHLRGTALEFLEGILPVKTREMLWEIIQERPPASTPRNPGEVLEDLLKASPTIVLLLKEVPPPDENVV